MNSGHCAGVFVTRWSNAEDAEARSTRRRNVGFGNSNGYSFSPRAPRLRVLCVKVELPVSSMTLVKICGITNLADALAAIAAGADALGFNFYEGSPRYISPEAALLVVRELPPDVLCVGVFVNESKEAVAAAVAESRVGAAQLHGDETPEFCAGLRVPRVIKALRARGGVAAASAALYDTEAVLLDAYDPRAWGGA